MTCYGIWVGGRWAVDDSGVIFWTPSRAVAEAQLRQLTKGFGVPAEVRAFDESGPEGDR